jgi:hypothetical protein
MQFQDRISQILDHVEQTLGELVDNCRQALFDPEIEAADQEVMLDNLKSIVTTHLERVILGIDEDEPSASSSEMTFF